jgi:Cdc6-like AAA superfamily ATPase
MKSEINFDNYPEQKYYEEKDFIINKDDNSDFYYSNNGGRAQMTEKFKSCVKNGLNYFITGPHGIGKTFSLFGALSILSTNEKFKYIYINLDILKKQKNKMEILLYEAKNLFKSEKDYISACEYLKDKLIIPGLEFPLIEIFNQKLILKLDNYLFILGINLCNLKKNNFYRGN